MNDIIMEVEPFEYFIIDNFLPVDKAKKLSDEFPDYHSPNWYDYDNPLELKKTINNWFYFPPETYQLFTELNGDKFIGKLKHILKLDNLYSDMGLHGGGWHIHGRGGKLNVHLDYSLHPKLNLERRLNLILYLTPDWNPKWGGNLEFWSHDEKTNRPKEKVKTIDCIFNRAVIFNTTQNSWHGFYEPINCPKNVYRKSIATYYLTDPTENTPPRKRALYSPAKEQENDKDILELIEKRVK
jgi:Rps23 Pro-64 3,4-dihydroxylase Tpa1-like proline 4-hydroxylase